MWLRAGERFLLAFPHDPPLRGLRSLTPGLSYSAAVLPVPLMAPALPSPAWWPCLALQVRPTPHSGAPRAPAPLTSDLPRLLPGSLSQPTALLQPRHRMPTWLRLDSGCLCPAALRAPSQAQAGLPSVQASARLPRPCQLLPCPCSGMWCMLLPQPFLCFPVPLNREPLTVHLTSGGGQGGKRLAVLGQQ